MGILEKAAQAKGEGEGKDSRDARETHKEEMPKKHKKEHKAPAAPQEADLPGDDAGGGADAESQPNAGSDNAQPPAQSEQDEQQDAGGGGNSDPGDNDSDSSDQPQGGGGDADQDSGGGGGPQGQQPQGGDQGGQGGAQGGAPGVPNPQAPGAGDDTSGGADTPAPGAGDTGGGETPGDDTAQGPGSNADLTQIPMSPAMQDELKQADALLNQALYGQSDDATATAVLRGMLPDPQHKLRSAIHTSLMLVTELHKKLPTMPPGLVMPFARDVTAHVLDLAQQVKGIQYSHQDCTAILGAVYEGIMRIWGVNKGQAKRVVAAFGKTALTKQYAAHKKSLAFAKPAMDAAAGGPQQGPPQTAGPQTGAPVGTQASPQSGQPPQPQVPPAQPAQEAAAAGGGGGGMMSQAAQGAQ